MEHDRVLDKLKENFGLRDNEILILRELHNKELTADEICARTMIPKGRVYDFLNSLMDSGLIRRKNRTPYTYGMADFRQSIVTFLKKREEEYAKKDEFLRSIMEKKFHDMVVIESREQLLNYLKISFKEDNVFRIVLIDAPNIMYPDDPNRALKIRKAEYRVAPTMVGKGKEAVSYHAAYREAYGGGKKFYYLMRRGKFNSFMSVLRGYYTREELCSRLVQARKDIKRYNISIRVSKAEAMFPYHFYMTESKLFLVFLSGDVHGLLITKPQVVKMFSELFDKAYDKGSSFKPLLDKAIKEAECGL